MSTPKVFISYSHKDVKWKNAVVSHLEVLQKAGLLDVWDDKRISAGEEWLPEIDRAIDEASVVIVLISKYFLTSEFILRKEVPHLLKRRQACGLRVIPLIVRPCSWAKIGEATND